MPAVQLSPNIQVVYKTDRTGTAIPLVLLHGFCEDDSVWENWLSLLPEKIPVIRINLPGFNGSSLPPAADMTYYAEAVLAVLDELDIRQCVLHGHSMGGYAALEFASCYPERLTGLGLFHSHPYTDQPATRENRLRGIETLLNGKRDLYVAQLFPGEFTPEFADTHPEIIRNLVENAKKHDANSIITALKIMLNRRDHTQTLTYITVPVQIIQGEADKLVPVESAMSAAMLPATVDLRLLPEVAHMGVFEAAEETAKLVASFWTNCTYRPVF